MTYSDYLRVRDTKENYRCENCGNIFSEDDFGIVEESHGFDYPPYERWNCCPVCKSTMIEKVSICAFCGDVCDIGEVCDECISDSVTYECFRDFLFSENIDDTRSGMLEEFMFKYIFHLDPGDCPLHSSKSFKAGLQHLFDRAIEIDKILPKSLRKLPNAFTEYIQNFCREEFSEYLICREKGVI